MWKEYKIDVGEVKVNTKKAVVFTYTGDKEISQIIKRCGCTSATYNKKSKTLEVIFSTGHIPMHLKHLGSMKTTKSVVVRYADGTQDSLFFTAIIKSKLL